MSAESGGLRRVVAYHGARRHAEGAYREIKAILPLAGDVAGGKGGDLSIQKRTCRAGNKSRIEDDSAARDMARDLYAAWLASGSLLPF